MNFFVKIELMLHIELFVQLFQIDLLNCRYNKLVVLFKIFEVRCIVTFVVFLLSYNLVLGYDKEYIFEQISPDAGFAFDQVSSIVEDENGFIWFGCNNGLYYYNSLDIKKYNYEPT